MDPSVGSGTFALFGIRVDSATLARATLVIWEGALSRAGTRVVLADLWTLLLAQREYSAWEALSGADYVLPLGDDAVIRRLALKQHRPVIQPDLLLFDLLDAAARNQKQVVVCSPNSEVAADVALVREVWPQLRITGISRGEGDEGDDGKLDDRIVSAINAVGPELLVMGGDSPWQESWSYAHRGDLDIGAVLHLPTLYTAMAAIGHRAGLAVTSVHRLRRRAAVERAIATTIAPVATASAQTVSAWLRSAREGLSELSSALQAGRAPAPLQRLKALPAPRQRHVAVRVHAWEDAGDSNSRWLGTSPLARLGPPRQPMTSPLSGDRDAWANQSTTRLSLNDLRAQQTQAPTVVSGYLVNRQEDTSPAHDDAASGSPTDSTPAASATPQPEVPAAEAAPPLPRPASEDAALLQTTRLSDRPVRSAEPPVRTTAPLDEPLAPTQRLRERPAPASESVAAGQEPAPPENEGTGSLDELPVTRRLPSRPARPPQPEAATPEAAAGAEPVRRAPITHNLQPAAPGAEAAPDVPAAPATSAPEPTTQPSGQAVGASRTVVRITHKYVVRRARRRPVRGKKRRRKPHT